jgi:hypothetical protein
MQLEGVGMRVSTSLAAALLVGAVVVGVGCTGPRTDDSKRDAGAAIDATRSGASTAIDATKKAGSEAIDASKDAAGVTADKTKQIAGEVAEKSKEIAVATRAAVTDGWVTTKVKAKFADETALERSDIDVDTTNHVVTLKGSVRSSAARSRAVAIAAGTEGVTRVVDQLVVKNN